MGEREKTREREKKTDEKTTMYMYVMFTLGVMAVSATNTEDRLRRTLPGSVCGSERRRLTWDDRGYDDYDQMGHNNGYHGDQAWRHQHPGNRAGQYRYNRDGYENALNNNWLRRGTTFAQYQQIRDEDDKAMKALWTFWICLAVVVGVVCWA